jgi:hypothetical protein
MPKGAATVRVALPYHLRNLARIEGDVLLECPRACHLRAVLDALEARYPMLRGTIRDYGTGQRRRVSALLCLRRGLVAGIARRRAARSGCNGE